MNRTIKILCSIITTIVVGTFMTASVFADEDKFENEEMGTLHTFISEAAEYGENGLEVYDKYGQDLTALYVSDFEELYSTEQEDLLINTVCENELMIAYTEVIQGPNPIGYEPMAYYTEYFTKNFYLSAVDAETGSYSASWTVALHGRVTYNTVTHAISSASVPTLDLISFQTNSPALVGRVNNISTNRTIYSTSVLFKGNYSIGAAYSNIGDISYNFGSYTCQFEAVPST